MWRRVIAAGVSTNKYLGKWVEVDDDDPRSDIDFIDDTTTDANGNIHLLDENGVDYYLNEDNIEAVWAQKSDLKPFSF